MINGVYGDHYHPFGETGLVKDGKSGLLLLAVHSVPFIHSSSRMIC